MKILVINTVGLQYEGITSSILSYFSAMDRLDMMIDFVAVKKPRMEIQDDIEKMGCRVIHMPARKQHPFRYFIKLCRLIAEGKYDIVHAHGNSSTLVIEMLAALLGRCKCRISHSHSTKCDHLQYDRLLRPFFYRCYTVAFACGTDAGNWLFPGRSFHLIPNGKDIEKYAFDPFIRTEYRKKYGLEEKIVIGHVGHFTAVKNHAFLIDVFRELSYHDPSYQLVLIGDGPLRPDIEQRISEYELHGKVLLIGRTQEVDRFLQVMDVMVLPSLYEGFPNVVLEWQIAGLPSLVSANVTSECKVTELIEFFPLEKGPEAWAKKIRGMKIPDRAAITNQIKEEMMMSGYDIKNNARMLRQKYQQIVVSQERV